MNLILIHIHQNEIKCIQQEQFNPSNSVQFEMTELSSFINKQIGYKLDEVLLYHSSQITPMSMIKTVQFPDENPFNSIILLFKKKMNKHTRKITPFKYPLNQSLRHLTH